MRTHFYLYATNKKRSRKFWKANEYYYIGISKSNGPCKQTQQVTTLLAQQCWKLLALVGTCCRSMHKNATIANIVGGRLKKRCILVQWACAVHEANIVVVSCKRAQHCCATLRRSQNNRSVGTCCAKSLTGFKLYATSANTAVVPCKWRQHVGPNSVASVCMGLNT